MLNWRFTKRLSQLTLVSTVLLVSVSQGRAQTQSASQASSSAGTPCTTMRCVTSAQRQAAAARAAARRTAFAAQKAVRPAALPTPGGTPDYFGIYPNYANSPLPTITATGPVGGIRKFVDTLPGLGPQNANNLGQYIPVAVKDTTSYPGSDYYQLAVVGYAEQMHSDLPATTQLRGYADLAGDGKAHYLGPIIIAQKNRPVRVKFSNQIVANSSYFLPVDTSIMGAGMGPTRFQLFREPCRTPSSWWRHSLDQ